MESPCYAKLRGGVPNIDEDGDESDVQQHDLRLGLNRAVFCLDDRVGGLSKEPPAADGPVKDKADKQFHGTGDELGSIESVAWS